MSKITPEKTHALLEKMASYVMNEVPTKKEMNQRFEQVDVRFNRVENDLLETKQGVKSILNGMDNTVKDMEILRTEQIAIHSGLRRMENRVGGLEKRAG